MRPRLGESCALTLNIAFADTPPDARRRMTDAATTAAPDGAAADARQYRALRRTGALRLLRCQCRARRGERARDEEHAAHTMTLVERGRFGYRSATGRAELSPGWLMLGNAGDGYACSHEHGDDNGDDCLMLGFGPDVLDSALQALGCATGAGRAFARAALPPLPRAAAWLRAAADEGGEGFALEEAALAVLGAVQRALHDGAAPAAAAADDERAVAAARYIDAHAHEPLLLDAVASAVGASPFHLMRVFRRAVGVTPHQYLMRVRLVRALALLRDSALPVTEVAYEAGWSDLSNFMRTFRRDVGCSPGQFRRHGAAALARTAG